jgi:ETC complex I subunit conserved region
MTVRIFKPAKTAMQSGSARTKEWVVEPEPGAPKLIDPLTGWAGSGDTQAQVDLSFDTREEAIAYCERMGLAYTLVEPQPRKSVRKAYADNFKFGRIGSWTH